MTVVDVLGSVDALADGMGGSVDAVTGAAIGPYRKSRLRRLEEGAGGSERGYDQGLGIEPRDHNSERTEEDAEGQ